MNRTEYEEAAQRERAVYAEVKRLAAELAIACRPIAHHGDGNCGSVIGYVLNALSAQGLYTDPRTMPKAPVDCAIIHLVKKNTEQFDFIRLMDKTEAKDALGSERVEQARDLMLPGDELKNRVIDFTQAVEFMKVHRKAEMMAVRFKRRLGKAINDTTEDTQTDSESDLIESMHKDYQALKDAA
jgi:hypothetical protein